MSPKPTKYSMDTMKKKPEFSYGSNANVQQTSLPNRGAPCESKGKPR